MCRKDSFVSDVNLRFYKLIVVLITPFDGGKMRDVEKVSSVMIKDHLRILSLLHVFEQSDGDSKFGSFDTLKWNLEEHISAEENVVFASFNDKEKKEQYNLFVEISRQHTLVLNELAALHEQMYRGMNVDGFQLREQLIKHQKFEEQLLYPRLDKELTEEERYSILDRIPEII